MMTSSNGNIFRATGALCGEFTGHWWIPPQRTVTRSFDVFFDVRLNKQLSKQSRRWWFETSSRSLWRHCNDRLYALMLFVEKRHAERDSWCFIVLVVFRQYPFKKWQIYWRTLLMNHINRANSHFYILGLWFKMLNLYLVLITTRSYSCQHKTIHIIFKVIHLLFYVNLQWISLSMNTSICTNVSYHYNYDM